MTQRNLERRGLIFCLLLWDHTLFLREVTEGTGRIWQNLEAGTEAETFLGCCLLAGSS